MQPQLYVTSSSGRPPERSLHRFLFGVFLSLVTRNHFVYCCMNYCRRCCPRYSPATQPFGRLTSLSSKARHRFCFLFQQNNPQLNCNFVKASCCLVVTECVYWYRSLFSLTKRKLGASHFSHCSMFSRVRCWYICLSRDGVYLLLWEIRFRYRGNPNHKDLYLIPLLYLL